MKRPNFYASGPLDRAAHLRTDAEWLAEMRAHPDSVFVPLWRMKNLIRGGRQPEGVRVPASRSLLFGADTIVFLGLVDETPHFAVDFSGYDEPPLEEHGEFKDMRAVGQHMTHEDGAMLVYARGAIQWHQRHQFCGVCGSATEVRDAGHMRKCTNADCGFETFPRIDPAVIMLVHDGGDNIVLGRQAAWAPGQHSVLAGFVEQGESLEDAVAREVFEEVGLRVDSVEYHSSQPWPFPSSIMLGYWATAPYEELNVDLNEMDGARWYTREQLLNSPEDRTFALPRRDSIARRMIEDWLGRD